MTPEDLKSLVATVCKTKTETQELEIKSARGGCPKKLFDTLSSFSNQDSGGIILFGVDEESDFQAVGVYDAHDLQKQVTEQCNQMTPVVIVVIFGTLLGELLHLEEHITHVFGAVTRKLPHDEANFDMERYITVVVLFCASGFGIYGVLVEGMSGSPAVLQSKAVLDLCTAAVFAVTLGVAVAVIALPMLAVMLALFFAAGAIAPFVTPEMLQDFISCGGVLTIVAGMRVSGIKQYPIANMIPALLLVLPASAIWQTLMV